MKKQIKDVISAEFKGLWGTDFSDDGIPVIKTNNMTYEGRIDYSDICLRNITSEEAEENFLCNGDLIIEKSGGTKTHSVGYVNIFEGEDNKYVCNNFILPIRPNRDLVNPKYLFWQLHGMYEAGRFSDCFNKTTGIQNLQKKTYFSKEINVPTLPEQQKIAAHLDSIQSAIDNKKQQLAQLDELVKSKFVEMFGENPVESGKWKVETLGSKSELITKGASPRWQGVEYQSEGTLFVTSENVREGYVDLTKSKYLPDEINEILPRSILKKNDVLINIVGASIGRAAIYEFEQKANINQAVALVRLNSSDLDKTFLLIYLNSELAMKLYQSMIKGGARDNLSLKNISDLSIPVPPIELQTTFAEYVQKIDSAKSIIKTQLEDLQELLDSKMDEYFGE